MIDQVDPTAQTEVSAENKTAVDGSGAETVPGFTPPDHAPDPTNLSGQMIGHFRTLSMLGMGGMGAVWKAHDESLDRMVALKVLPREFGQDLVSVERFLREARAQARVSHPNVVPIYFIGEHDDRRYFAMELVVGESLQDRLDRGELTGWEDAIELLIGVVEGLRQAQERDLIHRDIKPGNIMVTTEGVPKVADFGLAKRAGRKELQAADDSPVTDSAPELTRAGSFLGTPRYVAPEQALGRSIDHRADIYSLGATFFHLLAGVPVFDDPSVVELIEAHVKRAPDLDRLPAAIPPPVRDILSCMLAKSPDDRFASYDELLTALVEARPQAPVPAPWTARVATVVADGLLLFTVLVTLRTVLGVHVPWWGAMAILLVPSLWLRASAAQVIAGHRIIAVDGAAASSRTMLLRGAFILLPAVLIDLGFLLRTTAGWGPEGPLMGWSSVLMHSPWSIIPGIALALFGATSAGLRDDGRAIHDVISGTSVVQGRGLLRAKARASDSNAH